MLSTLKTHSVLYVEDEPEIQASIAEYLSTYFSAVYLASDGREALALFQQHHPDVVLLDIQLPLIDGLSVAKKMREHDQQVKIIMLSAYSDKDKLLKATELKLTKYLIKPVSPKLFKQTLDQLAHELLRNPSRFFSLSNQIIWDKQRECLKVNAHQVLLTEKERRLLNLLIKNHGKMVSYEKIIVTLWDDAIERDISIDSVKNQVSKLRKKLSYNQISSVYGEGYRLK